MALPSKTATQIITDFELQVSDITELSSSEELSLLNKVYVNICNLQPWEFLKTPASGTTLVDATGTYITMPADFAAFAIDNQYTENNIGVEGNASPRFVFLIDNSGNYVPFQIINFSDRRKYKGRGNVVYLDIANSKIRFMVTPQFTGYEFDYIKVPALLTINDTPIVPGQFHDIFAYAMASDNDILQLSPKAKSYQQENDNKYQSQLLNLQYWNANLQMN